ncbi:MAG: 23S rRNA (guanosine(2251)-2'-O)-methyltransferase RlmB [Bacteroidota bacterium]
MLSANSAPEYVFCQKMATLALMSKEKNTLIYGRHPVLDAIQAGQTMDKLILQQGIRGPFEKEVRQISKQYKIPVQVVPKERMNKITRGNHQGIIGFLALIDYHRLGDILPMVYEQSEVPLLLLLDGVTDVRNLGAIARSAACFGVHAIVVPRKGSAMINAEAIKTSAGALTKIPVCREDSLLAAAEMLQLSGVQLFASSLRANQKMYDLDFGGPTALVMGSEDRGVNSNLLKLADQTFIIPQRSTVDSFNVSVAAGIMLYEVSRQRGI